MNREIKYRYRYSDGTNFIMQVFTLAQIANGDPFEVLSDNPLLKKYRHVGQDQYTGLEGKNGKEIYEGDVVITVIDSKGVIEFACGVFGINWDYNNPTRKTMLGAWSQRHNLRTMDDDMNPADLEVIGNIYEHPELLK